MTLPITLLARGKIVTPRQFLHSFKSPRFGIFNIKPFFHWSGTFSSCHILLKSLVNSFTATSLSALYNSAGMPSTLGALPLFVFLSACFTSASFISVVSISLISSVSTSFSSIGFAGASLTSTSSKCSAHLSSLAFLSFIISPLLFLTVATLHHRLLVIFLAVWYSSLVLPFSAYFSASFPVSSNQTLLSSLALRLTSLSFLSDFVLLVHFVMDHLPLIYCFPGFLPQPLLVFLLYST